MSTTDLVVHPTNQFHHPHRWRPYVVAVPPGGGVGGPLGVLERTTDGHALALVVNVVVDEGLADDAIAIDQTIRTALGLPVELPPAGLPRADLRLVPLQRGLSDRLVDWLSGLSGRRYLLLRAVPPEPGDIEKRLCRIPSDDLTALGAHDGGRIVLLGAAPEGSGYRLSRISLQAVGTDRAHCERRAEETVKTAGQGWAARYLSASIVGLDGPDLSFVFIDRQDRDRLGLQQLSPVLARRDTKTAFLDEARDFGIAFLATLLAFDQFTDRPWRIGGALAAATAMVLLRLRAQLR